MKELWKIIALVMAVAGLLFAGSYGGKTAQKFKAEKRKTAALEQTINVLNRNVENYRIKLSDTVSVLVARTEAVAVTADNFKQLFEAETAEAKKLKLKINEINTRTAIASITTDTVSVPTVIVADSTYFAHYTDGYADIRCELNKATSKITYSLKDSLLIYDYYKKKTYLWGLIKIGNKRNRIDVFSKNPKTVISNVNVVKIIE